MRAPSLVLAGLGLAFLSLPVLAQEGDGEKPVESEVQRVVLYKHGLGYFEREAVVDGEARVGLNFKHDQMKDVLKSFYAVDLDGGRIANISYDSAAPLEKRMEEVLLRVPASGSLTGLLEALQGARLSLSLPGEVVEGKVLGLQERKEKADNGATVSRHQLVLSTAAGFRSIELSDVTGFQILDESLRRDVERFLELTLQGKYKDRKNVEIYAKGVGERRVRIGYLLEAPVWKTSYRLILRADDAGKPILQGWAMVENPTDEDWDQVEVSLVAGNPISFIMDLYRSYYPRRAEIPLQVLFPDVDVRAGTSIAQAEGRGGSWGGAVPPSAPGGGAAPADRMARKAEEALRYLGENRNEDDGEALERLAAVEAAAQGQSLGEMFEYRIEDKVSVPQGQSALVPVLATPIDGQRILYFQERISAHPLHAIELTNGTDSVLDNGPVTFFEDSASLGEGILHRTLKPGMKAIVTYAVETAFEVEKTIRQDHQPIHRIVIAEGILRYDLYQIQETAYRLDNESKKDAALVLDHFETAGFDLLEPKEADEKLPGVLRFRLEIEGGKEETFVVRERRTLQQAIRIDTGQIEQLKVFLSQPILGDDARAFLAEVVDTMESLRKVDAEVRDVNASIQALARDQSRYRENMTRLGQTPRERELRAEYVERLADSEKVLREKATRLEQLATERQDLVDTLARKIKAARFE